MSQIALKFLRRLLFGGIPPALIMLVSSLLLAIAFGIGFERAITLGMQNRVPVSVFEAIPPAISTLIFAHDKRYTSLTVVDDIYRNYLGNSSSDGHRINAAIAQIVNARSIGADRSYRLMGLDDKGIVDFVTIAFRLFGLEVQSVLYLYFLILFISCCCFILGFFRSPSRLILLVGLLIAFYLVLPMIAFNQQLNSVLSYRALPILSMVACLHCLLFALSPSGRRHHMVLVAVQVAILIFVLHLRTTTMWQVLTIAGVSLAGGAYCWRQGPRNETSIHVRRKHALLSGWPLILVIIAYLGLQGYRTWTFPDEYQRGEQIMTRTIWHNVFSGLAFHPLFAERYQLRVDDNSVIQAAGQYLQEKGRAAEWEAVGGGPPNFSVEHWTEYDKVVREMLFDRCTTFLSECAAAVIYYKPLSLARNLAWLYGFRESPPDLEIFVSRYWGDTVKTQMLDLSRELDRRKLRAYLWTPVAILLLLPCAILLVNERRRDGLTVLTGGAALFAGSIFPTLIGYPAVFTVADSAIAFAALVYFGICLGLAFLFKSAYHRVQVL